MAKSKVLLVEDDVVLRDLYQTRLELEGYQVVVAGDGEEGINVATKEQPDIVMLDLMLPKIPGMEVLEKLKNQDQTKKIPVVVVTALSNNRTKGLIYGAEDYLVKSESSLEDMVNKVKEVLHHSKTA